MQTFNEMYEESKKLAIDIVEHLDTLEEYASRGKSVLELGTRDGYSTTSLLNGCMYVTGVDLVRTARIKRLVDIAGDRFEFVQTDSRTYDSSIGYDMLFIDTCHQYAVLKKELEQHHKNIKRYIIMHDTVTFGLVDEFTFEQLGLLMAINEFLAEHTEWEILKNYTNNNGLMILERI